MTWAKVDDGFLDHPKVLVAGEEAANLYLRGLVWCCKHLTDGAIPREALRTLTTRRDAGALAVKLVAAGLWEVDGNGWRVHDFHDHNPTAAEVKARRSELSAKRSEAGKLGGIRSGQVRGGEANGKQTGSKREASAEASAEAKRSPVPSRPVPDHNQPPKHTERVREAVMVEVTGVDAEQALVDLRDRTRRTMNLAYDLTSLGMWVRAVRALDGQGRDAASYQTLGDWIAAGGFGWWRQGRPTLAYLLRPGKLAEHLEDAAEWHRAGRPAVAKAPVPIQGALRAHAGRLRPAAPSSAADFAAERDEEDPLLAMLGD